MRTHILIDKEEWCFPDNSVRVSEQIKSMIFTVKPGNIEIIVKHYAVYKGISLSIVLYHEELNEMHLNMLALYYSALSSLLSIESIRQIAAGAPLEKETNLLGNLCKGFADIASSKLHYNEELNYRLQHIVQVFIDDKIKVA